MIWYVPTAVVDHGVVNRVALSLFLNIRVRVFCRRCRGAPAPQHASKVFALVA